MFRKPKRNVRQRRVSDGSSSDDHGDSKDDDGLKELQSNINKFKEIRHQKVAAKKKDDKRSKARTESSNRGDEKKSALLSFGEDLAEGDDGEVFQVKKSSQSRRLVKHMKAEKKKNSSSGTTTIQKNGAPKEPEERSSWTLSGREAEAVHMEDEDQSESESGSDGGYHQDPLQKLLKSGSIPDAAAIHAARKQREAAREGCGGGGAAPPQTLPPQSTSTRDFISLTTRRSGRLQAESDDSDDGERITFTGVRSAQSERSDRMEDMEIGAKQLEYRSLQEDDEESWERQQIRKAMPSIAASIPSPPRISDDVVRPGVSSTCKKTLPHPATYDLQGIKCRLVDRLRSLHEVSARHEMDLDRAVDEMVSSRAEIDDVVGRMPGMVERHHFYQDLKGYVADLVECYGEKLVNVKYLEEKCFGSKEGIFTKIAERRRQDVRDQMKELTTTTTTSDEGEEEARRMRAAEREGRRRRRQQIRNASQSLLGAVRHADGMSSDDELSTSDQTEAGKVRQDVENQARLVMADVVEDFASIRSVCGRFERWKTADPAAYGDAFVSVCLPKIVAPIVRLEVLFWNPLAEHTAVESMGWFRALAGFGCSGSDETRASLEKDPDRKLLSMVVEKVLVPKVTGFVRAAYDPMSTAQSLKLTGLLEGLVTRYPTITGDSKQVRELLVTIKDRLKYAIDNDVYIPIGYPKQFMENPLSQHSVFLNRQFWSAFKLYRNVLAWHGILSEQVVADMALNSLLNRYMVIGLGVLQDPSDVFNKCRHIVGAIPRPWLQNDYIFKLGLDRFSRFLVMASKSILKLHAREVVKLLKTIGAKQEAETMSREI